MYNYCGCQSGFSLVEISDFWFGILQKLHEGINMAFFWEKSDM